MYNSCLNIIATGDAYSWFLTNQAKLAVADTFPMWHQPH